MRKLIVGVIATASATFAFAADRVALPEFYGNTWELTRPNESIWIYLNVDGTWDGIFSGTFYNGLDWRTIDGNTCFFNPPDEKEAASGAEQKGMCFRDLTKRKVGESWQLTVVGRDKVWNAALLKGRKVPPAAAPEKAGQ